MRQSNVRETYWHYEVMRMIRPPDGLGLGFIVLP